MQTIVAPNPMSSDIDWAQVEATLGMKIVQGSPDGQIVFPVVIAEGEADLLRPVGQKMNRLGELGNRRVGVTLEIDGPLGRCLAVLDALKDQVLASAQEHGPSSSSVASASSSAPTTSPSAATDGAPEAYGVARSVCAECATSYDKSGGAR